MLANQIQKPLPPAEMDTNSKDLNMKTVDVNIKTLIANAAEIIAPLWPMQTIIARNPLQCIESLNFEDAIAMGETFLVGSSDMTSEVNREMVKWCQVFLDEGQATITMPEREKGFYRAWSLLAPFDDKLQSYKKMSGYCRFLPKLKRLFSFASRGWLFQMNK